MTAVLEPFRALGELIWAAASVAVTVAQFAWRKR